MDAMAALEGPLANLLLIGPAQLPRFAVNARNGDLVRAVNAIFTTGRNVAALVNIPGQSLSLSVTLPSMKTSRLTVQQIQYSGLSRKCFSISSTRLSITR